jgi:DNA-binding CsgD family transcriptional regulator
MPYSHEGSSAEGEVGPKTILVREDDEGIGELITETESAPLKLLHVLLLLVVKQDDVLSPSHCIVPFDLPLVLEKLRALRYTRRIQFLRFGRMMKLEQVLAAAGRVALSATVTVGQPATTTTKTPAIYLAGLTARGVEVLRLAGQGASDAQVAETLTISPRTGNWHLTSIDSKIGVSSRSAATRYAFKHHLFERTLR